MICRTAALLVPLTLAAIAFPLVAAHRNGAAQPAAAPPASQPTSQPAALRIKAGTDTSFVDPAGNAWAADKGFAGGDVVAREPDLKISDTNMPAFYRTEHYDMTSWSADLPNGTYTVKLYFCETFEDINAAGLRVFSFALPGHEVKNFDIFKEANGFAKPITKTFENIPVTDGKLKITFTAITQSPAINGIEVIPMSK